MYWVVYDREAVAKYSDALHKQAYDLALASGIEIALTNVCFEVWLLLHFQKNAMPFASFAEFMRSSEFKKELKKCGIKSYEKGQTRLFKWLEGEVDTAKQNALAMNANTLASAPKGLQHPYELNPYTTMPSLIDAIQNFE